MKKARLLTLAAALCAGAALPASAAWDHIGSVDFSFRPDRETEFGSFGGRIESLSFRARNGSVRCSRITATFNNGRTRELYSGMLPRGRDVVVDLPGQSRLIRRIDFNCRSIAPRVTRVDIAADIGRYGPGRLYGDGDYFYGDRYVSAPLDTAGWITLGTEVFDGPIDRETTVAGFYGRDVDRLAVRPLDDDARCSQITATFANGITRDLNVDDREILQEDRIYELDLPGGDRNVTRVDMTCRAENGRQVTMLVMADR